MLYSFLVTISEPNDLCLSRGKRLKKIKGKSHIEPKNIEEDKSRTEWKRKSEHRQKKKITNLNIVQERIPLALFARFHA